MRCCKILHTGPLRVFEYVGFDPPHPHLYLVTAFSSLEWSDRVQRFLYLKGFSSQHDRWEEEDDEGATLCLSSIIRSYFLPMDCYLTNLLYGIWRDQRITHSSSSFFFHFHFIELRVLTKKHTHTHKLPVLHRSSSRRRRQGESKCKKSSCPFSFVFKPRSSCWPGLKRERHNHLSCQSRFNETSRQRLVTNWLKMD